MVVFKMFVYKPTFSTLNVKEATENIIAWNMKRLFQDCFNPVFIHCGNLSGLIKNHLDTKS